MTEGTRLGFTIRKSDIDRCPITSLSPSHYNVDGTCKDDGAHDAKPIDYDKLCDDCGRDDGSHDDDIEH